MDYLWQVHLDYHWRGFLGLIFLLGVLYTLLVGSKYLLKGLDTPKDWQERLREIIQLFLLLFEPLVILTLSSYFILIQPFFHGLIVLFLLLTNLQHIKNYFCGRIILFDAGIHVGARLKSKGQRGIIIGTGRLGLRLQEGQQQHFLDYSHLLKDGYTLLADEKSGLFFRIHATTNIPGEPEKIREQLWILLQTAPFINWRHQLKIKASTKTAATWMVNLALHDEQHLNDLLRFLEEANFSCQIAK
ncbi:MAG: hypothetical protein DA408_20570 [Bacteroidetes bacterium]|nr:MAG: hypothetical protein C7N36_17020 [Bacteroidota bacterium]PTM08426.1 MAG: hypothetical protein DA408_20570 [Bacteroidota bacterium]